MADAAAKYAFLTETTSQTFVVILAVVAMLILVVVVIYIVSLIKTNKLQSRVLHDIAINLENQDAIPYQVDAAKMAIVDVGKEFTFSFWLYLQGVYEPTARHKLIFQRGNPRTEQDLGNFEKQSNPIVFLDRRTNKMYIVVSTSAVKTNINSYDNILKQDSQGKYISGFLVTTIDYVPLQRWVNIVVVVKDSALFAYLDADMYSAISVSDLPITPRPLIQGTTGNAFIGDKKAPIKGALSNTKYYNYALTQREIKNTYNEGPYPKSWLSWFGIQAYGVRSPIYNIEDSAK